MLKRLSPVVKSRLRNCKKASSEDGQTAGFIHSNRGSVIGGTIVGHGSEPQNKEVPRSPGITTTGTPGLSPLQRSWPAAFVSLEESEVKTALNGAPPGLRAKSLVLAPVSVAVADVENPSRSEQSAERLPSSPSLRIKKRPSLKLGLPPPATIRPPSGVGRAMMAVSFD